MPVLALLKSLPWKLIGVVLAAALVAGAGYRLVGSWEASIRRQQDGLWEAKLAKAALDQTRATQAIADAVGAKVGARLGELSIKQQPILREIHRETRTLVDPRCDTPDGVLDNLNRLGARGGLAAGAASQPDADAGAAGAGR